MVQQLVSESIEYPESDGLPLADNTIQFRLITTIHGGLDVLLSDTFVAADLLWYPVEGDPNTSAAPDVMVAFGRPKGERRSYKQWEEDNVAPQVVFEIASPSNSIKELEDKKFKFYRKHGVEEYYLFDPDRQTLKGWLRDADDLDADSLGEDSFEPIAEMNGWVSPRLEVRFEVEDGELQLYRPDGRRFPTYAESEARADRAEAQMEREKTKAKRAQEIAELERTKARLFAEQLRQLGIDPDQLL